MYYYVFGKTLKRLSALVLKNIFMDHESIIYRDITWQSSRGLIVALHNSVAIFKK